MFRTLMFAAGMAALLAPLSIVPAAAQNANQRGNRAPAATAGRDTMLRAGPQAGYPQLRRIDRGQQVQLFGCVADRNWCEIGSGPDRGWVSAPDLQVEVRGRTDSVANLNGEFDLGDRDFRIGDYWDENYRNRPFFAERDRWERQYRQDYRPSWGAGPDQNENRRDRDGRDRNWQPRPQALMLPMDSQATHGNAPSPRLDQR